jgi:hypothetical protein
VPSYWVLDPSPATLTVHLRRAEGSYQVTIVNPPSTWTDPDLGLTFDPGELCRPPLP